MKLAFPLGLAVFLLSAVGTPASPQEPERSLRKRMREMSKPGESHRVLDALEGNFHLKARFRMTVDDNPERVSGRATGQLLYGGRFAEVRIRGRRAGRLFEGCLTLGFDNYTQRYVGTWIHNYDSGITLFEGPPAAESDAFLTLEATANELDSEQKVFLQAKATFDPDGSLWHWSRRHPETGEEVVMVELRFERVE